ncbi:MAG: hypothetical protein JO202_15550 [Ktedonobacteraceae bacterium]|nr:hypothetical protein [Ktedonobacteraceae bacterium]
MLTPAEQNKACQIGAQVARKRGYSVSGKGVIGRRPSEQCAVVVVVAPARRGQTACHVHVVLEIAYTDQGRCLRTLDVHAGSTIIDGQLDCDGCDAYHTDELYYEEIDAEDLEGHECEGGSFWDDGDGKGGFTPCTRTDTQWYEFWMTGTAGWYCPSHWPYDDDIKAIKRARERAAQQSAPQA